MRRTVLNLVRSADYTKTLHLEQHGELDSRSTGRPTSGGCCGHSDALQRWDAGQSVGVSGGGLPTATMAIGVRGDQEGQEGGQDP